MFSKLVEHRVAYNRLPGDAPTAAYRWEKQHVTSLYHIQADALKTILM